jgi:KaiC/GvpD/RAD55 family RecA-like ATPase
MDSSYRISIPLFSGLVTGGIRPGTIFAVEFDPESEWFSIATTIVALLVRSNRQASYLAMARPPADLGRDLTSLGVDVAACKSEGLLRVNDWYSPTLTGGRLQTTIGGILEKTLGEQRVNSLKVADLSVEWLRQSKESTESKKGGNEEGRLVVVESLSEVLRFNEEKPLVEWVVTRVYPEERRVKHIALQGLITGIHSEWFYKRMEAASDGVIEVKVRDIEGEAKSYLRLRSLRGQPHDSRWHLVEIKPNGEAVLVS